MAKKKALLPEREFEIMKALWKIEQGTVYDVQKTVKGRRAYTTIQTMLKTLEQKDLVGHDVKDRTFIYYPKVSRSKALQDHIEDVIERVFDGSVESVLVGIGKVEGLSEEELAQIQELIQRRQYTET